VTARSHTRTTRRQKRRQLIRLMRKAGVSNQTQFRALNPRPERTIPRPAADN